MHTNDKLTTGMHWNILTAVIKDGTVTVTVAVTTTHIA